jgi:ABC-type Fe3+/spermidine/putrescine transport system ATPase subunit
MNSRTGFELRSVCKSFGTKRVLNDVSLSLPDGQHTTLIGASGCGKSTLLRLLAGLESPDAGEILLDGRVISTANDIFVPPHQRGVSMVFQDLALWPNLTALENVILGLAGLRLTRTEARSQANEMLRTCGIETLKDRRPGTLSGGEQQRVALARSLALSPRFLILDEPFAGLDGPTKCRLLAEVLQIVREKSTTLIVVTHDPFEAVALAEHAVVLDGGRANDAGRIGDLMAQSPSPIFSSFRDLLLATQRPGEKNENRTDDVQLAWMSMSNCRFPGKN